MVHAAAMWCQVHDAGFNRPGVMCHRNYIKSRRVSWRNVVDSPLSSPSRHPTVWVSVVYLWKKHPKFCPEETYSMGKPDFGPQKPRRGRVNTNPRWPGVAGPCLAMLSFPPCPWNSWRCPNFAASDKLQGCDTQMAIASDSFGEQRWRNSPYQS